MRMLWSTTALLLIAVLRCHAALAAPQGGITIGGAAVIDKAGPRTTINQSSNRAIIRWDSFNVGGNEQVVFNQPGASSITVNRIQDSQASKIDGSVSSNGTLLLLNPNGVLFGKSARVDVGGLVASTSDISDDNAFMAGGALRLDKAGHAGAAIVNHGRITVREAGLVGFVAPNVQNNGTILAKMGRIQLAGGDLATFDLAGDGLISIAVSEETLARSVVNKGSLLAEGGSVLMTAATARDMVDSLISNEGRIETPTLGSRKGRITLQGEGARVTNAGTLKTEGQTGEAGGDIAVSGGFVAMGGTVSANGATGGTIDIAAETTLSLADQITANGLTGVGGAITLSSGGNTWEIDGARISADGKMDGGSISNIAAYNIVTSAEYFARGQLGQGGYIDITAAAVKTLSATVDVSGGDAGGQIRIGGEFQGGKNLPAGEDELPNAMLVTLDRGTRLRANGKEADSDGGRVIVWSDQDTLALATITAKPGLRAGDGGFVEVSSAGSLSYGATIQTGQGGRSGQVLLDPKNITIAEGAFNPTAIIMGRGYTAPNAAVPFEQARPLGFAVALDGLQLAIGQHGDNGAGDATARAGAAYLYTFTDSSFSGGTLQGIVGHGYTGGKNIDLSAELRAADEFGISVSLDGNRLAVGAQNEDGQGNILSNAGGVYLFTFSDAAFSGGALQSRIGAGYNGAKDLSITTQLNTSDNFGRSVSLDGNRLAVGAVNADGVTNGSSASGEVFLFSFSDAAFTAPVLEGRIGQGYTGGKNLAVGLGASDVFGNSVSLDGNRLAVGAHAGDGVTNATSAAGEVYLFSFADDVFSSPVQEAIIGQGYTGGKNVNLAGTLASGDNFGYAVALDGNRLAVGAINDDGAATVTNSGAVYLYTFSDSAFNGATLEARIGANYATLGGKNLSRANEAGGNDQFGAALALDGNRLVVGAIADDGTSNFNTDQGAFHFYTFGDAAFSAGAYQATFGTGYSGGKNRNFAYSTSADAVNGQLAVSLDGTRLAIGLPDDDGFGNTLLGSGAVYLYSFASNDFDGATLQSIIGANYAGGKNVNLSGILGAGDRFGFSVSLDGNRLAVGAPYDDGNANVTADVGGAYLFTFSDSAFNGGSLAARIGRNYGALGGNNRTVTNLDRTSDFFGSAISLDGNRLAVGAYGEDGVSNARSAGGAVFLFSFTDSVFSGGVQQATIGYNYTGGKNFNLSQLGADDNLGVYGLSLDGNRLAVSAQTDDGHLNAAGASGAVYLFTFADSLFTTPTLQATMGFGYGALGGKNISMAGVTSNDYLTGVALEGNLLAIGSSRDDGVANALTDAGAIYVYSFADASFSGGVLDTTIGFNYTGGKNINTSSIAAASDFMGRSLDLSQGTLVAAAPLADGSGNLYSSTGEVYIYRGNGYTASAGASFGNLSSANIGITPGSLTALLSTPQDVTLQASNDITVNEAIIVNNAGGNGGTLTLQAGRSININANITTDSGNLNLYANEDLSNGVIDAQRDAGGATITMAAGTTIDAGTGTVTLRLDDGTGKTHSTSGNIVLNNITAGSILTQSLAPTASVILNGILSASDSGTPLTVAAGKDFINQYGAGALLTPSGRWLIYSDSPVLDSLNGLSPAFTEFRCVYSGSCTPGAGNGAFYEYGNNLLSVSVNAERFYGYDNPDAAGLAAALVFKGLQNGDDLSDLDLLPSFSVNASATAMADAGTVHAITVSGGSDNFYEYYFLDQSVLTITKAPVTAMLDDVLTREYGDNNPTLTVGSFSYSGFRNGQTEAVIIDSTFDFGAVDETTDVGSYAVAASFDADNYIITATPTLAITKREITASWNASLNKIYGDANPTVTNADFTYSALINGDAAGVFTPTANFNGVTAASDVGSYGVGASFSAANYLVTNAPTTTLNIGKRDITASVGNSSRAYGDANPALSWSNVIWNGLVNGNTGAVIDAFTIAAPTALATSDAGTTHALNLTGFSDNNYNLTSATAGQLTINKRVITAVVNNASRAYGDANPTFDFRNVVWSNLANLETGAAIDAVTIALAGTATATANAGTNHAISLSGFSDNNYTLGSSTNGVLNITKRDITATVGNASRAYGDANPTLGWSDVVWNNLANSETGAVIDAVTVSPAGTATATANAGTNHAINLSGFSDNNYNLTGSTAGVLAITKRDITASVNNAVRAYGDANPTLGWNNVTWNNLANSETGAVIDAVTIAAAGTATATAEAGTTHTIDLSGFSDNNYNLTSATAGQLTINKRVITAVVNNASRAYGDTNPTFDFSNVTWSNLANSETGAVIDALAIALAGTATAPANAGTSHAISLGGFSDNNYTLGSSTNGALSITKRDITATVGNATRAYGAATPTLGWMDITWDNLVNDETGSVIDAFSVSAPTAVATSGAGTLHALGLAAFSDNNYNLISFTAGELSIEKALLTVRADNAVRLLNEANPAFNYTVTGLRNGESSSLLSGVSLSTLADATSPVGSYAITAAGGTAANYTVNSYIDGQLTVSASPIVLPPPVGNNPLPSTVTQPLTVNETPLTIGQVEAPLIRHENNQYAAAATDDYMIIPDSQANQSQRGTLSLIAFTERLRDFFGL